MHAHTVTAPAPARRAPAARLPRLSAFATRHPLTSFLLVAYPVFWVSWLPVLWLQAPPRPATAVGVLLGIALPSVLITAAGQGKAGVHDLLRRGVRWRVSLRWYAVALFSVPFAMVALAPFVLGQGVMRNVLAHWAPIMAAFLLDLVIALLTVQLAEELGWTGLVQHRLQARHGALKATLLVAVAFAGLHAPTYLVLPLTGQVMARATVQLLVAVVFAVFFRTLVTWVYNRTGFSVLLAALVHASFNEASAYPFYSRLGTAPVVLALPILIVTAIAVGVLIATRSRLGMPPRAADFWSRAPRGRARRRALASGI